MHLGSDWQVEHDVRSLALFGCTKQQPVRPKPGLRFVERLPGRFSNFRRHN